MPLSLLASVLRTKKQIESEGHSSLDALPHCKRSPQRRKLLQKLTEAAPPSSLTHNKKISILSI